MGRGDKKSRKGKIFKGSFGNSRRKKKSVSAAQGVKAGDEGKAKKAPRKKAEA
jgi:ribosomal small subunit protein bTHX